MSYVFQRQKVSDFRLNQFSDSKDKMTLNGVDGEQADANVIVNGIQQLLSVVGWQNRYDPTDAQRTVKERVSDE